MNLFHSAKVAFFLSLTTLFTLPTSAVAATPLSDNWFQVEMMLVAYRNNSDIDQEYWPKVILDSQSLFATMTPKSRRLDPVAKHYRYRRLQTQFLDAIKLPVRLPDSLWQPLAPMSSLKLKREANRINPQADMDVVWHQSWLEPVQSQEGTIVHKVNLTVGGEPEIQITGGFSLYLSRYLHISTDFHVQHLSSQMPAEPQLQAFSTAINTDGTSTPAILASQQPLTIHGLYPIRATEVRQKRRMRSKELHYIDHPMLGVVLIITPVEFPDLTAGE